MKSRGVVALLAALICAGAGAIGISPPIKRAVVSGLIDAFLGVKVSMRELEIGGDRMIAAGLHVERHGRTMLDADRAELSYALRDLLPGGKRRFGLVGLALDHPVLRLTREPSGRFNVPGLTSKKSRTPWRFTGSVKDGVVLLDDPSRLIRASREQRIDHIDARATVDSGAATRYDVRGFFEDGGPRPVHVAGTIDRRRGFALHHLTAETVPLPATLGYLLNTNAALVLGGTAHAIDVRAYAPALDAGGGASYHLSGGAEVSDGILQIIGFRTPFRNVSGHFDLFDDSIIVHDARGTLASVPIAAFGGIYSLTHPVFRLFADGTGTLERLRAAFPFSVRYPVRGTASFSALLEGAATDPLVLVRFSGARLAYDRFPITDARGVLTYYERGIDLLPASATYGGIGINTRGHIGLGVGTPMRFDVEAAADGVNVPYAAQIVPRARLRGSAALFGPASGLAVRALLDGAGGGDAVFASAHVNARGEGAFAPILVARADGAALAGAFYLDRPGNGSAFWIAAKNYRVENGSTASFPGLKRATSPEISGVFDGVAGGAGSAASSFALAGSMHGNEVRSGATRLDDVAASFAGSPNNVRFGRLRARGPWGQFAGAGGYTEDTLALDGAYTGSFEQLRAFTGELGARGKLASRVALTIDPRRVIVQARGGEMRGASIQGVPLEGIAGTLEVRGRKLRVDAADLGVAGGNILAAGEIGDSGVMGVTAEGIQAKHFGRLLQSGTVGAIGTLGYAREASFNGGILLDDGLYAGHRVRAVVDADLRGSSLRLTHSEGSFDQTYGVVDGRVSAIGTRDMRYDLALSVRDADVDELPGVSKMKNLDGSVDAQLRIAGRGAAPRIQGELRIPQGTVNGLRFEDATADIDVKPASSSAEVRSGSITVGSTYATFSGGVVSDDVWVRARAAETNLADFNDFFDAGDTLGGTGRIALDAEKKKGAMGFKTGGDIAVAGLRYRDFVLGNTAAAWKTVGDRINGRIAFGGASGRLQAEGSVVLGHAADVRDMLARSRYDLATTLQGLDLGVWLPLAGYHVPLVGRVNANAVLRGRYPGLLIAGTASMDGGSVWSYPIDHFNVTASSDGRRTTIDGMTLDLPALSVRGAGSFGAEASDPLTVDVHASSTNIGSVLTRAIARGRTVFGTLDADLHVDGTRGHPRVAGSFDVEHAGIRGVVVPRVVGSLGMNAGNIVIHSAEADFQKGRLMASGTVPFTGTPPHIGPAQAPVSLRLTSEQMDLSAFQPLLPTGSKLGGVLDGLLTVEGFAQAPQLRGKIALDGGTLLTPFERTPLRNVSARVSFGKTKVHLRSLHADAGRGTLDARGTVTVADLMQLTTNAAYVLTLDAKHAKLDFPAYGSGTADGTVTIEHTPRELPLVYGTMTANDAVIPFSALYRPMGAASVNPPSFDVALNIDTIAAHNVRVRSANMDIGASGSVNVGGTLSYPQLSGAFTSNSGTLAYYNRIFRVEQGTVTFERSLGIMPSLDARSTTHVFDPSSSTGAADITLTLTGPVTNLTIGLESDPSYDREQILALLLNEPQLGALLSGGVNARGGNGNQVVGAEAFGLVDAQFTRALLTPLETAFGQALGLSDVNVNFNYGGSVNVSARKLLGKSVNIVYASDVSYPFRQSVGFELKPNRNTSAQLSVYQALAQVGLGSVNATNVASSTNRILLSQPLSGTNGFSFTFLQYLR